MLNEKKLQEQFNNSLMDAMLSNAYRAGQLSRESVLDKINDDLTEEEAVALMDDLTKVFIKHNLSYKNSYRVSLALTCALAMGGLELYKAEIDE